MGGRRCLEVEVFLLGPQRVIIKHRLPPIRLLETTRFEGFDSPISLCDVEKFQANPKSTMAWVAWGYLSEIVAPAVLSAASLFSPPHFSHLSPKADRTKWTTLGKVVHSHAPTLLVSSRKVVVRMLSKERPGRTPGEKCVEGSMVFLRNNFRCPPMLGARRT